MKKTILFLLLFMPFISFGQKANKADQKAIKKVSAALCSCIGNDLNKLDKDVQEAFITTLEKGDAGESYVLGLKPELQQRMQSQLPRLSNIGDNIEGCMESQVSASQIKDISLSPDEILKRSIDELNKSKKCKNTYRIFKLVMHN